MQFTLIASILLLVPLASTVEPTPSPYFKLLFQDGFVVTESSDLEKIHYYHTLANGFAIHSQDKKTVFKEYIYFKSNVKKSAGFAVESYRTELSPNDARFYLRNADEQLKHLIYECHGAVLLRLLTEEEKAQIEQYKKELQESKKPFELVYDRTRVTSKANDLHEFYFVDVVDDYEYHGLRFSTRNTATDDENRVYIEDKLASRSFVVEGLPSGSKEKCTNYRLGDLDIACSGMIKVKEYQAKPN